MELVNYFMKMVEYIKANFKMISSMEQEFTHGQMVKYMKVAGPMENNMGRADL